MPTIHSKTTTLFSVLMCDVWSRCLSLQRRVKVSQFFERFYSAVCVKISLFEKFIFFFIVCAYNVQSIRTDRLAGFRVHSLVSDHTHLVLKVVVFLRYQWIKKADHREINLIFLNVSFYHQKGIVITIKVVIERCVFRVEKKSCVKKTFVGNLN